jgi:Fic family protein
VDFTNIRAVALDKVTQELFADAHSLAAKVHGYRPLPAAVVSAVQSRLLGERIYNSNAIEGNTLTLRETVGILEAGTVLHKRRSREAQEVLGLKDAMDHVQQLVDDELKWRDISEFLSVHERLFGQIEGAIAGRLRLDDVMLTGAKHQPPDPSQIAELMQSFFLQLASANDLDALHVATWVHWAIARIHPFKDGNGRMARLWQDLVLFRGKLTAAIIPQQDRTEYYAALTSADDGDFNPLAQMISQRVSSTLQVYLSALQEADDVKKWAAELVGEASAQAAERKKLEYFRWKLQIENLRGAFERCAAQITNASAGAVEIQIVTYPTIDQPVWESLRGGTGAKQTWFFTLNCRRGQRVLRYFFFFGKHFWSQEDQALGNIGSNVCLLISEQDMQTKDDARRLDEVPDSPVTIRELLVVESRLICKRWDNQLQKIVYDDDADPIHVAQQFLQEVLLSRLN